MKIVRHDNVNGGERIVAVKKTEKAAVSMAIGLAVEELRNHPNNARTLLDGPWSVIVVIGQYKQDTIGIEDEWD